jgi:hypothetical protein
MFNPQDDPLGLGLQSRARAHRWADSVANPMSQTLGPLPDPMWDSYFQAVAEAAKGKKINFAGGTAPNETFDESFQDPSVGAEQLATIHSNQFRGVSPSLAGLRRLGRK